MYGLLITDVQSNGTWRSYVTHAEAPTEDAVRTLFMGRARSQRINRRIEHVWPKPTESGNNLAAL